MDIIYYPSKDKYANREIKAKSSQSNMEMESRQNNMKSEIGSHK